MKCGWLNPAVRNPWIWRQGRVKLPLGRGGAQTRGQHRSPVAASPQEHADTVSPAPRTSGTTVPLQLPRKVSECPRG